MGRFPQIMWVVVEKETAGLPILEQMIVNNLRKWGEDSSFAVHIVSVEEAYQHLSPQMTELLAETLQTRKIEVSLT